MTPGGERRRLALTKVRPAGEQRRAASLRSLGAPATSGRRALPREAAGEQARPKEAAEPGSQGARAAQRSSQGIGAGAWGPRGGGAASLGAAPGRGLSATLLPPAPSADSKRGGGCRWPGPPQSGCQEGTERPLPPETRSRPPPEIGPGARGYVQLTVPSDRLSSGPRRRRCAQLCSVRGDGGHDGDRMGANNGKQYGSEGEWAACLQTPGSVPPLLPLSLPAGKEGSARCRGASPFGTTSGPSPFPLVLSDQ